MSEDQTKNMLEELRWIKARLVRDLVRLEAFIQSQYTFDPSFPFEVANPRFAVIELTRVQSETEKPREGQWISVAATLRVEVHGLFCEKNHPYLGVFPMGLTCRAEVDVRVLFSGGKYAEVQYQSAVVFRS